MSRSKPNVAAGQIQLGQRMRWQSSRWVCSLVMAGWMGGCAAGPEAPSPTAPPSAAVGQQAKSVQKKQDQFGGQAEALLKDVQAFRGQSGWYELAPILKKVRQGAGTKESPELQAWGQKWSQSPDGVLQQYQQLVERSAAIDKQRKALADAWLDIQTKEKEQLLNSGQYSSKNVGAMVANSGLAYEMNRVNLSRYGLDELGLFARISP